MPILITHRKAVAVLLNTKRYDNTSTVKQRTTLRGVPNPFFKLHVWNATTPRSPARGTALLCVEMKVVCSLYTPGLSLCQNPTPYQSQLHSRGINRDSTHTKVFPVLSNFQCVHYGSHLCGICTAWSEHTRGNPRIHAQ